MIFTYSGAAVAVLCLWFFTAYVPYHNGSAERANRIAEAQKQLADFQRTIAELPEFIERQKNLISQRADLNSKLYTKKDVLKLFDRLQQEADIRGVEVKEITPPIQELLYLNDIIPETDKPQFLNIGLRVEGDFISFGKYIQRLEGASYFRGINRCKMYAHADDDTRITMQFDFRALLGNLRDEG